MRLGRLDLNLLIALDHLITLRSITQAGNRMNMTQSAMSSALGRLREYFDDQLLVKMGREMELTPRALALKQPLHDILVQLDVMLSAGLDFDPRTSTRQFRCILSDYAMAVFVPHLLALAAQAGAATRFKFLAQVQSPHTVIERGDADLMIAPKILVSDDHPSEALFDDRFVSAVWNGGRLAGAPMSLETYLAGRHAVVVPPTNVLTVQDDFLERMGIHRIFEVECYSYLAVAQLVVGTDRIATIHRLLGRQLALAHPLDIHPLPFDGPVIEEYMQWHRHMSADAGMIWVRRLAHRAALLMLEAEQQ